MDSQLLVLKISDAYFFILVFFPPRAGRQQTFMHTTLCLHCCTPGDKGYRLTECCQSGLHNISVFIKHVKKTHSSRSLLSGRTGPRRRIWRRFRIPF